PRAVRRLLRAMPRPRRRRRRHHRGARLSAAAVLSRRPAAGGPGAAFLRRDHQGLRRHVLLRRPRRPARSLGHRRLHPGPAAVAARQGGRRPRSRIGAQMSARADTPRMMLPIGVVAICVVGVVICAFIDPKIAAAGWLVGFAFWSAIAIGSLLLMMIRRLTGGRWGDVIRPDLERSAATIPLLVILMIPLFVAIPSLFP